MVHTIMTMTRSQQTTTIFIVNREVFYFNMIKTKSIYKPKDLFDGERILISRLQPRGIKKTQYYKWLKELSPSIELIHDYKSTKITWRKFLSLYKYEIQQTRQSLESIRHITKKSKNVDVTLLCFGPDGDLPQACVARDCYQTMFFHRVFCSQTH